MGLKYQRIGEIGLVGGILYLLYKRREDLFSFIGWSKDSPEGRYDLDGMSFDPAAGVIAASGKKSGNGQQVTEPL